MLDRTDRMLLAVSDRKRAAKTFETLLGAQFDRESKSAWLNADRTVMRIGESELELCEAAGPGPVHDFITKWGEGLFAAGYSSARLDDLAAHLGSMGVPFTREDDQLHLPGTSTFGFPMVISRFRERPRIGPVSYFYEATNALDTDWRVVADRYSKMFGLDASRFSPIESERFGYEGTLTLFDPPARLDRIELSQTFADQPGTMRRFVERRGGDALNMCFIETDEFDTLKQRLLDGGATLTARSGDIAAERDGMWVHPKNLHGLLLGISRGMFAWDWSGRPDLVVAATPL